MAVSCTNAAGSTSRGGLEDAGLLWEAVAYGLSLVGACRRSPSELVLVFVLLGSLNWPGIWYLCNAAWHLYSSGVGTGSSLIGLPALEVNQIGTVNFSSSLVLLLCFRVAKEPLWGHCCVTTRWVLLRKLLLCIAQNPRIPAC